MPFTLFPTTSRTFTGTVQDVLDRARTLLQDEGKETPDATPNPDLYRYSDPTLIRWVNDALAAALRINPSLFVKQQTHACTAGWYQTLSIDRAVQVTDVVGLLPIEKATLDLFAPNWQNSAPGTAINWMPAPGDPNSFIVYPPSPSDQALPVLIVQAHIRVDDPADIIELPEIYIPALAQFVVGMVELGDDEHVNTQREQSVMNNFGALIKGVQPA